MDDQIKKCSFKDHKETNAIFYCIQCKVYMCNKCENFHSKLLENHQTFKIEKDIEDVFLGICKEENHQIKLEYFCKSHNQLCCAACIAKIKKNENGKHKDCDVCLIEDIKDEKKNKIKDNINYLKDISNNLQKSLDLLKTIFEKFTKDKEELKKNIQQIFTKIRNELNNREDELLLEVDKKYNNIYFNDSIMKESEKLPNKIKLSLEKVCVIDKEYNDNNLSLFISDCINIENNIKEINTIKEKIDKCNELDNFKITFIEENGEEVNKLLENIKEFGCFDNIFKEINNPWTTEILNHDTFLYTLKDNNYLAEKTKQNGYINLIKSSYQFKKNKIYKLVFLPNYRDDDFHIGFADSNQSAQNVWLKNSFNCVALTNDGLYINGSKKNNLNLENGKKYEFIIDISKKSFILNIDEINAGKFNFNFQDNIYAHAGIRNIGNSIRIKTYEK